jgi:hypothetical protein
MLRADDLPPQVRARLGIALKRGRPKKSDQDQADRDFLFQCQQLRLPPVFAQWRFEQSKHPGNPRRKWRTDFVIQAPWMLMIEIDGGVFIRGAHGNPADIVRNMAKGNDAILLGFTVLHFTPSQVKSGHAISFTETVLKARGWK